MLKLAMFDLDGTLIKGHVVRDSETGRFRELQPFGLVKPLPGVNTELQRLRVAGKKLAICTNKAGVAFGHETIDECDLKRRNIYKTFSLTAGECSYHQAFGHPHAKIAAFRGDDPLRKPKPGMLIEAMVRWHAFPDECIFVGDMQADMLAAEAVGVEFHWARDYFDWDREMEEAWLSR